MTVKEDPADLDVCWDIAGVVSGALDPILRDLGDGRAVQKRRFGGELLPNLPELRTGLRFNDFFQLNRDGSRKGIVILRLGDTE